MNLAIGVNTTTYFKIIIVFAHLNIFYKIYKTFYLKNSPENSYEFFIPILHLILNTERHINHNNFL